eukprot:g155.t1
MSLRELTTSPLVASTLYTEKEGWLKKKKEGWKKIFQGETRYFRLHELELSYYVHEYDDIHKPRGIISLSQDKNGRPPEVEIVKSKKDDEFVFHIKVHGRTIRLVSPSEEARKSWVRALLQNISAQNHGTERVSLSKELDKLKIRMQAAADDNEMTGEHHEDIELTGWMYKQGKKWKTWRKRWFVMKNNSIKYFKNCSTFGKYMHPLGMLNIDDTVTIAVSDKRSYCFEVVTLSRTWYFAPGSIDEREEWMECINNQIQRTKDQLEKIKRKKNESNADFVALQPRSGLMEGVSAIQEALDEVDEKAMEELEEKEKEEEEEERRQLIQQKKYECNSYEDFMQRPLTWNHTPKLHLKRYEPNRKLDGYTQFTFFVSFQGALYDKRNTKSSSGNNIYRRTSSAKMYRKASSTLSMTARSFKLSEESFSPNRSTASSVNSLRNSSIGSVKEGSITESVDGASSIDDEEKLLLEKFQQKNTEDETVPKDNIEIVFSVSKPIKNFKFEPDEMSISDIVRQLGKFVFLDKTDFGEPGTRIDFVKGITLQMPENGDVFIRAEMRFQGKKVGTTEIAASQIIASYIAERQRKHQRDNSTDQNGDSPPTSVSNPVVRPACATLKSLNMFLVSGNLYFKTLPEYPTFSRMLPKGSADLFGLVAQQYRFRRLGDKPHHEARVSLFRGFSLANSVLSDTREIFFSEEMYESWLTWQIPALYLKMRLAIHSAKVHEMKIRYYDLLAKEKEGTLKKEQKTDMSELAKQLEEYTDYTSMMQSAIESSKSRYNDMRDLAYKARGIKQQTFKKSSQKTRLALTGVPTNLHVQLLIYTDNGQSSLFQDSGMQEIEMNDEEEESGESAQNEEDDAEIDSPSTSKSKDAVKPIQKVRAIITYGAPADHCRGFKKGGLYSFFRNVDEEEDEEEDELSDDPDSDLVRKASEKIDGLSENEKDQSNVCDWYYIDDENEVCGPCSSTEMREKFMNPKYYDMLVAQDFDGPFSPVKDLFPFLGNTVFNLQDSILVEKNQTDSKKFIFQMRKDIAVAQALSAMIASFQMTLEIMILENQEALYQLCYIGFLYGNESLLSTYSNEAGMIEDMMVSIKELQRVRFKVVSTDYDKVGFSTTRDQIAAEDMMELHIKLLTTSDPESDVYRKTKERLDHLEKKLDEAKTFYYHDGETANGPFSLLEMRDLYEQKTIDEETYICRSKGTETTDWELVSDIYDSSVMTPFSRQNLYTCGLGTSRHRISMEYDVASNYLTVIVRLVPEYFQLLPDECQNGRLINVYPFMYTMGINEMQTIANMRKDKRWELHEIVNRQAYILLNDYYKLLEKYQSSTYFTDDQLHKVRNQLYNLNNYITNLPKYTKSPELLQLIQSAKDRTGMSVTLEEAQWLLSLGSFHIPRKKFVDSPDLWLAYVLRKHGVRITNCHKNTNKRFYAFNKAIQRPALPLSYRAPYSLCGKVES